MSGPSRMMYQYLESRPEGTIFSKRSKPQGTNSSPHDTAASMAERLEMNIQGTRWTRQITGPVDLSEMDCIARRHAHDFCQVNSAAGPGDAGESRDWPARREHCGRQAVGARLGDL